MAALIKCCAPRRAPWKTAVAVSVSRSSEPDAFPKASLRPNCSGKMATEQSLLQTFLSCCFIPACLQYWLRFGLFGFQTILRQCWRVACSCALSFHAQSACAAIFAEAVAFAVVPLGFAMHLCACCEKDIRCFTIPFLSAQDNAKRHFASHCS